MCICVDVYTYEYRLTFVVGVQYLAHTTYGRLLDGISSADYIYTQLLDRAPKDN